MYHWYDGIYVLDGHVVETGLGIPLVHVVVAGGSFAYLEVINRLKDNFPVVLCKGTGGAADILAYVFEHVKTTRE